MNIREYIAKRNAIIEQLQQHLQIWEDPRRLMEFNLTSANLLHYLPDLDYSRHESLYKDILLHQHLSGLEQSFHFITQYATCEYLHASLWQLIREQPVIFCTFHTGSYRLINLLLMKNQIPYSLVIARDILQQQGNGYYQVFDELYHGYLYADFHLIDAEHPHAGLQMLRDLKKGRSLLLYADGNTGAGNQTAENDNSCIIRFLRQSLFARKGIAYLSHAANVPIVPVICYRKSLDDIRLRFFDPIYPDLQQSRLQYASETTQLIYGLFESVLKEYPEQWEAWLYLHKTACIQQPTNRRTGIHIQESQHHFTLNHHCYGVFQVGSKCFLFNKNSYESYPVDDQVYGLLFQAARGVVAQQQFTGNLFRRLAEEGVLLPC